MKVLKVPKVPKVRKLQRQLHSSDEGHGEVAPCFLYAKCIKKALRLRRVESAGLCAIHSPKCMGLSEDLGVSSLRREKYEKNFSRGKGGAFPCRKV